MKNDVYQAIKDSMKNFVGELGLAQAGLQFIHEKWNSKLKRGVVRVNNKAADKLKASFTFINSIKNKHVVIHSVGTSGILIKAEKKHMVG